MQFKKNAKIVIIDDNSDITEMIQMVLSEEPGFKIEIFNKSENFVNRLGEFSFENCDLIIIDIMMPVYDGFQVIEKLNANEKTKDIPKMVLTAYPSDDNIKDSYESGVMHFITKPFNITEFFFQVKTLLKVKMYEDFNRVIIKLLMDKNKQLNSKKVTNDLTCGYYEKDIMAITNGIHTLFNNLNTVKTSIEKGADMKTIALMIHEAQVAASELDTYRVELDKINILLKSVCDISKF